MKTVCIGMRNLLVWIFLATNVFAQPVSPGDGNSGTNNESPLNTVHDYGTNLWLSISLSNNAVQLLLHNTQPGVPYLIRSRADLVSGSWFSETAMTGAIGATATPIILRASERTNVLFIQALTWVTNATGGTIAMLAIGGERIMELTTNGDVICRGGNQYGELGDCTFLDSTNPVHIAGLTGATKIASGLYHSLALDRNGTVWAWGQNNFGQLGDDDVSDADIPVQVLGMTNAIAVDAHGYNGEGLFGLSSAVRADGTVWMWGLSECIAGGGYVPAQVAGISNASAVAIGDCHGLALLTNGTVWMWGNGSEVPAPVEGLSNMVTVCAGDSYSLALASNGTVWSWGYNDSGQLGDGGTEYYRASPVMVAGLTNVISIAAGARHSMAVEAQGRLWAWGDDGYGQLGDGGLAGIASRPLCVPGVSNIVSMAAGARASAALDGDGNLWQWGGNDEYPGLSPAYVDFYNGQLPRMQILSGNHQTPHTGLEFPLPLALKVTDANGVALNNAPVSVEVISGDMELRTSHDGSNYRGLRLTADANGEVSLIGYADRYADDTNCLMRVLAASRERIAEVDFNETLILPPTISITSPMDGATVLVSPNQSLTITVDAEAAAGASIQKVNCSYQINGGEATQLGSSAQSPYSFIWTDNTWWTNAFVGRYTITAVAVDDVDMQSDPQSVNITVALDSEGEGMPDFWQLLYFDQLGVDPDADSDGDGISNLEEYQQVSDPTDFYNGRLPYLELLGGNDQAGNCDSFLPEPVRIKVSASQNFNTFITPNAPVTFTVIKGTALLAATTNDIPASSLVSRSDSNGQVSAWVYFPPSSSNPPDSTILVSAFSGTGSVAITVNEFIPLARWRFDDTNTWIGEQGQLPLLTSNVASAPSWSGNAVSVGDVTPGLLAYNVVEAIGRTNINCQTGSVLFWFKPDWTSASIGGNGPGSWGRLIEMGNYDPAIGNGWWSLYLNPDGTQLLFATAGSGGGMTNLSASISWYSNEWYQIAMTYSPTGSALYVDGQWLADGAGVTCFPNADALANGFRIGSDENGNNQARGAYDELEIFNYPLAAADTATCTGQVPDWWEIKYFNQAGMDPDFQPDNDGFTLLINYQRDRYPNVINFSIATTNCYVTNGLVPVQIHLQGGVPFGMAVAVITTNFVVVPNQLFDISSNFIGTPWQPGNSNVVVTLNGGDGDYYVWVGLRGLSHDAQQTWQGTRLSLDTVPPILTITNPAANVATKPIIQLEGCANESLSSLAYDVSNAGGIWTNQIAYVTGQFCDVNLLAVTTNYFQCYNVVLTSNGENIITLHATDLAGNTTTSDFSFTFDASANTNPPTLTVRWPQNGTYISGSNFTLQAQVSDPMTAIVASVVAAGGHTNIVQGLVEQSGLVWVQNLPLAGGTNMVAVIATDSVGNTSVTNLTLFRSSVVVTMNPPANDQLNQPSMSVSGTVSDSSCTLTINGVPATVHPDGTWEADNVPASSSGTATFDVEVYSGSIPELVRANGGFTPLDAPSGGNAGSQLLTTSLPVKVGLMSYLSHSSAHGVIAGGRYAAVSPCCGAAFANNEDTVNWAYQTGGAENGYDYGSGYFNSPPGSPGMMMLCAPKDIVWANPLPAGRDAYGAPWGHVSDAEYYFRSHVMIEPEGQLQAGPTATYLVQAQAWDVNGAGQLAPGSLRIAGVPLTDDGTGSGYRFLSAPAGVNVDVTPMAAGNYIFNVQATELNLKLAVDNNRDGQITFDNSDVTTPAKPYRFWVNDSQEHDDDETSGGADDQIPGIQYTNLLQPDYPNFSRDRVRGRSDLVNFFPIAFGFGNSLQLAPPSDGYEYHLYQADSAIIGGAVKFVYTSLTLDNAFSYLTDANSSGYGTNSNEGAKEADTIAVYPDAVLDTNWLAHVQNAGGTGIILVEGCAATPHPLMLEIWRNGNLLAGTPLCLSISPVERMFRHVNFSYVNGTVEVPARADAPNEPTANDKNFVFLTGYNVNQQQARGVLSEMFKRMYWSGSKAKFYGVTWNGAQSQGDVVPNITANFQTNVVNAILTASHLADFLGALPADKTVVAAHSLGNLVVLSAICDYAAQPSQLFMIDSAVAIESIDGSEEANPDMVHPDWASYESRLQAAKWHNLWPNDARSTLTWSNRLANLGDVDVYNFYSSGEDVLRDFPGAPPDDIISTISDIVSEWWHGTSVASYVWVWQEKNKGRMGGNDFISSNHGGWGFNNSSTNYYWTIRGGDGGLEHFRMSPADAALLAGSELQTNAFFDMSIDAAVFTLDTSGSAYAQANGDRILSDAIPALSLPVGANLVSALEQPSNPHNFNMSGTAFESEWPRTTGEEAFEWHHSDFDYVAYPFTHQLFDKIVELGYLK